MNLENTTVKDIAAENPSSISVFERYGIDFCCNGQRTLSEACRLSGADSQEVIQEINASAVSTQAAECNWNSEPLAQLIRHILERHHQFLKKELPRLNNLAAKVTLVHGDRHPEFAQLESYLFWLTDELVDHMQKEEAVLFPHIEAIEKAHGTGGAIPSTPFGTVRNPIRVMEDDHDQAGGLLRSIRKTAGDFKAPADGCNSLAALYQGLKNLEEDLHAHIHLENNILFPRAAALESEMQQWRG